MYFISNEGSKTVKPKPVTKPPAKKASAPIQSKPVLSTKVVKKVIPVQPYVFSQLFYSFPREMIPMFFVNGICCSCWAMPWVVISDVIIASDLFMFRNGGVVSGKVKMNYLKKGIGYWALPKCWAQVSLRNYANIVDDWRGLQGSEAQFKWLLA